MDAILHLSLPVAELDAARAFYVDVLGCSLGRVRDGWIDVWFHGMQLTLHERPDEVLPADRQGARHFGVALPRAELEALVTRLRAHPVDWVQDLATDTVGHLDGKTAIKIADPSGNVIEFKTYPDDGPLVVPQTVDKSTVSGTTGAN